MSHAATSHSQCKSLNLQKADNVESYIRSIRHPSVQVYSDLQQKLTDCDVEWLMCFLEFDGLKQLLYSLNHMTSKDFTNFLDAILQLDCMSCIRTIANRKVGIECLMGNPEYVRILTSALSSSNVTMKKQVFEMLAALCAYSDSGHHAIDCALVCVQKRDRSQHKFSVLLRELALQDVTPVYSTAILAFINVFINRHQDIHDRLCIFTQLSGLGIDSLIERWKSHENDDELFLQIKLLECRKFYDFAKFEQQTSVDFNDSSQIFELISSKIFGRIKHSYFLEILQDLLYMEISDPTNSERKWQKLRDITHDIYSKGNAEPICPSSVHVTCTSCDHCCDIAKANEADSLCQTTLKGENTVTTSAWMAMNLLELTPETDCCGADDNDVGAEVNYDPAVFSGPLKWAIIDQRKLSDSTIWRGDVHKIILPDHLDLQDLFHLRSRILDDEEYFTERETSLKLNLVFCRTDHNPTDLVESAVSLNSDLSTPILSCLMHIIQDIDEAHLQNLSKLDISSITLSPADKFLHALSLVKNGSLLIKANLLFRQITTSLSVEKKSISLLISVSEKLIKDRNLSSFFHLILKYGNTINENYLNGKAFGFKLSSLHLLCKIRSCKPQFSLLHYIVKQCIVYCPRVLQFLSDLSDVHKASLLDISSIQRNINEMAEQWDVLKKQTVSSISFPSFEPIEGEFHLLDSLLSEFATAETNVAKYFCYSVDDFKFTTCLQILSNFFVSVKSCKMDILMWEKDDSSIQTGRNERKVVLAFGKDAAASSSFIEDKCQVVENILSEIRRGVLDHSESDNENCVTPDTEKKVWDLSPLHSSLAASPHFFGNPTEGECTFTRRYGSYDSISFRPIVAPPVSTPIKRPARPITIELQSTPERLLKRTLLKAASVESQINNQNQDRNIEINDKKLLPEGPVIRLPVAQDPKNAVHKNTGPAGNLLGSNFTRHYRGMEKGNDAGQSRKRASIMGSIVSRFSKVVFKPRGENTAQRSAKDEVITTKDSSDRNSFKKRLSLGRGKENKAYIDKSKGRKQKENVVAKRMTVVDHDDKGDNVPKCQTATPIAFPKEQQLRQLTYEEVLV